MPATGAGTAGRAFTQPFSVSPAGTTVVVTGDGCSYGADDTTGKLTLTVTRDIAGDSACTVTATAPATAGTAGTATAQITVTFAAAPTRAPSSPRNLRCSAATATTATWSWDAADRAHSYWYRYSRNHSWSEVGGQDARTHTLTGITPRGGSGGWANWRYIYVIARNNIGDSNLSPGSCLTLPPNWLTATCSNTGQITATWTKPLGLNDQTTVRYTATATYGVPSVLGVGSLDPSTGTATTSTHTGEPGTTYTIRVQTQPIANKPVYSETTTVECEAALATPTQLAADCADDAEMSITWSVEPSTVTATSSRYFEVEIDGAYVADAGYIDLSSTVAYTFKNPTPRHTHTIKVRERASARGETEFSAWASATEFCDRWIPKNVEASCTSHGVVTLQWEHLDDATDYQTIGINYQGQGGTGNQRLVHAQRQEGQTYEFQVQAHTAGDWGDPSTTATAECDPFDPDAPTRADGWENPNDYILPDYSTGWAHILNPGLHRYVLNASTDPDLGRDNCSETQRNEDDPGWTRTCTVYWTEHLDIEVDDDKVLEYFQHGRGRGHGGDEPHLHKTADGRASVEAHRHCGDHTTDGTCTDESHVPDLPWHPPLPDPGDTWWDNALEENGASIIIGTTGGAALGYVLAKGGGTVGSTLGPVGTVVGAVLGFAAGMGIAWLNSRDDDVALTISGVTECLAPPWLSATDTKWTKLTEPVEQTFEQGGYTTIIEHKIAHCQETVG